MVINRPQTWIDLTNKLITKEHTKNIHDFCDYVDSFCFANDSSVFVTNKVTVKSTYNQTDKASYYTTVKSANYTGNYRYYDGYDDHDSCGHSSDASGM